MKENKREYEYYTLSFLCLLRTSECKPTNEIFHRDGTNKSIHCYQNTDYVKCIRSGFWLSMLFIVVHYHPVIGPLFSKKTNPANYHDH